MPNNRTPGGKGPREITKGDRKPKVRAKFKKAKRRKQSDSAGNTPGLDRKTKAKLKKLFREVAVERKGRRNLPSTSSEKISDELRVKGKPRKKRRGNRPFGISLKNLIENPKVCKKITAQKMAAPPANGCAENIFLRESAERLDEIFDKMITLTVPGEAKFSLKSLKQWIEATYVREIPFDDVCDPPPFPGYSEMPRKFLVEFSTYEKARSMLYHLFDGVINGYPSYAALIPPLNIKTEGKLTDAKSLLAFFLPDKVDDDFLKVTFPDLLSHCHGPWPNTTVLNFENPAKSGNAFQNSSALVVQNRRIAHNFTHRSICSIYPMNCTVTHRKPEVTLRKTGAHWDGVEEETDELAPTLLRLKWEDRNVAAD
ncbi:unnamed protein product [Notodromas monacha]|uniref:Uncharacterized protein n=1 Tax=Notodromas monacha TaxID=399045 RepID=A0A7R9GDD1_9CRUS|nr:unnamed protein product [Notodromas monacha]CAG0916804.1 unnamed protein product [Notodromas monacha]